VNESLRAVRAGLAAAVQELYPDPAEHPTFERWVAYHGGELPASEEEGLQEHLVSCPECFDLVQAINGFRSAPEAGEVNEVATEAEWRLFQAGFSAESPAPSGRGRGRRLGLPSVLAASLVALVGLAVWNLHLHRTLRETGLPRVNTPILQFSPAERALGPGDSPIAGPGPLILVFHPPVEASRRFGSYRVTVRDRGSALPPRLDVRGLRLDEDFALTLTLPGGLPPGDHALKLFGREDGGTWEPIADYALRVTARRPGSG